MRFVPVVFPLSQLPVVSPSAAIATKKSSQVSCPTFRFAPGLRFQLLPAASFVSRFERQVVWMWSGSRYERTSKRDDMKRYT